MKHMPEILNIIRCARDGMSDDAMAPNAQAIRRAERLLDILDCYKIESFHCGPAIEDGHKGCVDGGVCFTFFNPVGVEYSLQYLNTGHTTSGICDCGTDGGRCAAYFDELFSDLCQDDKKGDKHDHRTDRVGG